MRKWLTPSTLPVSRSVCKQLRLPADLDWIICMSGAIQSLCESENWEQFGPVSPEQAAYIFQEIFLEYSTSGTTCMIGMILPSVTKTIPDTVLYCDGSLYSKVDYPLLYDAISSVFVVDANHFRVPDLRGRVVIGTSPANLPWSDAHDIGETGGEASSQLSIYNMPGHRHTLPPHSHLYSYPAYVPLALPGEPAPIPGTPTPTQTGIVGQVTDSTGGGQEFSNMQPFGVANWVIVAR